MNGPWEIHRGTSKPSHLERRASITTLSEISIKIDQFLVFQLQDGSAQPGDLDILDAADISKILVAAQDGDLVALLDPGMILHERDLKGGLDRDAFDGIHPAAIRVGSHDAARAQLFDDTILAHISPLPG
jgi:hypothetical protein